MTKLRLNLGSGLRPIDGYLNIDNRPEVNPDMVWDLTDPLPWDDGSIAEVRAYDVLEHVPIGKVVPLIEEIYRVLEPDGLFESFTPSTDGRGAFQDPTHVSFWNCNSWLYFCEDAYRDLYGIRAKFKGEVQNIVTNPEMGIVHVLAILLAVK